ncbi:MAG: thermonuclease family protein [Geminicoccaceae bacterium]
MALFLASAVLSFLVAIGSADRALAAESLTSVAIEVEKVSARAALILGNGSKLCLAGIWVPAPAESSEQSDAWQSAWHDIIEADTFVIRPSQSPGHDRYGCRLANPVTDDGASLQRILVEKGWAAVDPSSAPDDVDSIDMLLALEDRARRARRGIWKDPAMLPKQAAELSFGIGTRQIVEGRVKRIFVNDRYVYLNFGADWRTDFTIRLSRKMIGREGFDADALDGKMLRVRGVLQDSRGPLIDVSNLQQIEFPL